VPFVTIIAYEHVGIRVSDRARAVAFYAALGFRVTMELPDHDALELTSETGVVLNLILNGVAREHARNVLIDEPTKMPGVTHAAFTVPDLDATIADLRRAGIALTDGPLDLGRRRVGFVRDPDGTVIELDELKNDERSS
jgi:lactoylglutathione lyase